jgi:hypothetical protein
MIFARSDKFLFDHLPKTGGTALRTVLENVLGRENVSPHLEGRSETWAIQKFSRFRLISGHFLSLVPGDCRSGGRSRLTMLRNPIDRAVSEYFYWRHNSFEGVDDKLARWAQEHDICTFFKMREDSNETAVTNFYAKHFSTKLSRQLPDADALASLAKESLAKYDFVGIFEHMHDSVDLFCWQYRLPPVKNVPRVNVTSYRVDVESLGGEALAQLKRLNVLDLELYDFALDLFEQKKRRMHHELIRKNDVRARRRVAKRFPSESMFKEAGGLIKRSTARALGLPARSTKGPGAAIGGSLQRSSTHEPADKSRDQKFADRSGGDLANANGNAVQRKFETFGDKAIEITSARISGADSGTNSVAPGELILISIFILAHIDEANLTVGMEISDSFGETVFGTNTYLRSVVLPVISNRHYQLKFMLRANLNRGRYTLGATLHTGADHLRRCFHWCDNIAELDVVQLGEPDFIGYCRLEPVIEWQEISAPNPDIGRAPR